jgi:aminoethylphosphonate catabolism LysR family transcriptional regulator
MRHAQLRAFHAVAACGGFSRAAERLGLSQPAVSDHVRHLEQEYRVQLFVRGSRSVALTGLGRELYALAERQFEVEREAVKLLTAAQALEVGELVFAADAAVHALPLIARFLAQHPKLSFSLKTGNSATAMALLDGFQADFAVVGQEPSGPGYVTRLLRRDPLVAFVGRGHPLSGRRRIGLGDLAAGALVVREIGSVTRSMLESELTARGLAPAQRFEVEGREAVREAVAAGLGVGIVAATELGHDDRIAPVEIGDARLDTVEYLVCLEERRNLRIVRAFFDAVRTQWPVNAAARPGSAD